MANKGRYIPKFQTGGYFGAEAMMGEKGLDIRELIKAMKEKQEAYDEGQAKRSKWRGISDFVETAAGFIPGAGKFIKPALNVLSEQIIQHNIPVEGGPDLSEFETMWTEGEAEASQEEWDKIIEASDISLGDALIQEAASFLGSEVGGKFMEGAGEKFGDLFSGSEDALIGAGSFGSEFTNKIDPFGNFAVTQGGFEEVSPGWREGGRVPKFKGGGMVEGGTPTIVEYFSMQGKTLGGSNTGSLAEKLNRRT